MIRIRSLNGTAVLTVYDAADRTGRLRMDGNGAASAMDRVRGNRASAGNGRLEREGGDRADRRGWIRGAVDADRAGRTLSRAEPAAEPCGRDL